AIAKANERSGSSARAWLCGPLSPRRARAPRYSLHRAREIRRCRTLQPAGDRTPEALAEKDQSELLVELAPHLEDFVAALFGIGHEARALQARHDALAPLYTVKRLFVQRRAAKSASPEEAALIDGAALAQALEKRFGESLTEASYARHVAHWLEAEAEHAAALEEAARYAAWALHAREGR